MDIDFVATQKRMLFIAGIIGLLGVALGAFGSHGLSSLLEANGRTATFDTAVQYHLIHAVVLMVVALLHGKSIYHPAITRAGLFFTVGIIVFSGKFVHISDFRFRFYGCYRADWWNVADSWMGKYCMGCVQGLACLRCALLE